MRRRKLLISIGALGAGGTAAFGTEAFTSVEAQRSVDVEVADDQDAFLAIQPLSGNNANDYVTTENDDTVALNFDGDDSTSGEGINQDAVTQIEDLFKIINQGTQATSVFFEDDSDAVTFRVTRSTNTNTQGPSGESLEGAGNSVELETGEQVAVGLTVDTLNNNVSGNLVDDVTIRAKSGASAPEQSIPQPQYVVQPDDDSSDPNRFGTVQAAIDEVENNGDTGAVVGIEAGSGYASNDLSSDSESISIGESLTLVGFSGDGDSNSTPNLDATGLNPPSGSQRDGAINIQADDVTLRNLSIEYNSSSTNIKNAVEVGSGDNLTDITIDGLDITNDGTPNEAPVINLQSQTNAEVKNNDIDGGAIGISFNGNSAGDGTIDVIGNSINVNKNTQGGSAKEGIFIFSGVSNKDIQIKNNQIVDSGDSSRDIKIGPDQDSLPNSVNGQTETKQEQLESILAENDIASARIDIDGTASNGTKATGSAFNSIQEAVDTAVTTPDGLTLVEAQQSGSFSGFKIPSDNTAAEDGFLLKASGTQRPVIDDEVEILSASANDRPDGVTIEGLRFEGPSAGSALDVETGGGTHDNLTFRDNEFVASDLGVFASNIKNSEFIDNLFTVGENKTARELLVIGKRDDSSRNGSNVDVTNNDFQTPGSTSLSRSGQTSGGNAIEYGPDDGGGADNGISDNNFNVDVDKGVTVLIGRFSAETAAQVANNNTGVNQSDVKEF